MNPFERILVATDLSNPAHRAAERAAMVSRNTAAALHLLHVADLAPLERIRSLMGSTSTSMGEKVLETAAIKLGELADTLQAQYGVKAGVRVAKGNLLGELSKVADALKHDLLVCGSRGESVVRHFVLGTTALRLISLSTCPILVVKQQPRESYRKLLIPVDFSPSSLSAIEQARRIAPGAEISLVHAYEALFEGHLRYASVNEETIQHYQEVAKRDARQKLQELRDEAGLGPGECQLFLVHGNPALRILQYEVERGIDLLVLGKHGKTLLDKMLMGSVTRTVLAECQGDVLVTV
jgi:universal stress protein E